MSKAGGAARPVVSPQRYSFDWLLDLFCERGYISEDLRGEIETRARTHRAQIQKANDVVVAMMGGSGHYEVGPGELLASFSVPIKGGDSLDEEGICKVVAHATKLGYHRVDPLELDMQLITQTLSRPYALKNVVLPLSREGNTLKVVVEDPFNEELIENLERITQCKIARVLGSKSGIIKAITEVYGFRKSVESAAAQARADVAMDFEQLVRLRSAGESDGSDQHIVNAVDFLLRYAFDQRASDIHIEPRKGDTQVRLRIDGVLHDAHHIPRQVHPAITSRLKTLSRMDIAEKRRPQDGRIKTVFGDKEVELRVSTLPVAFGEKTVIRIFDPTQMDLELSDLGLVGDELIRFNQWIEQPNGIVLITGPTGSGKTTTLYTALRNLADEAVNVTSVEDPIEMITERFNQVAVQSKVGVTFAHALRTILRQDPDVIMIGEIRDRETAEMAIQAALTGHLVFSTLHTNDSVGAITRLLDLGVPRYLVGATLTGVMAQRLVRKVCPKCGGPHTLTDDELAAVGVPRADRDQFAQARMGVGCHDCRNTGYRGRVGIFELCPVEGPMKSGIQSGEEEGQLRKRAREEGMRFLREAALQRLAAGETTVDELLRVTGLTSAVFD